MDRQVRERALTIGIVGLMIASALTMGVGAVAGAQTEDTGDAAAVSPSVSTTTDQVDIDALLPDNASVRYELVSVSDGVRYPVAPGERPSELNIPDGEYLVRPAEDDNASSQFDPFQITLGEDSSALSAQQQSHSTAGGLEVRATVGFTYDQSYPSDGTVNLSVSVVNATQEVPQPIGGENLTVRVTAPDGTESVSTLQSSSTGTQTVPIDLAGRPDGEYEVRVTANDTSATDYVDFYAGPYVRVYPQLATNVEIGQTTTVKVAVSEYGAPQPSTSAEIAIRYPNGTRTTRTVTTDSDGFATFDFTPQQSGEYTIRPTSAPGDAARLTASDVLAQVRTNDDEYGTYMQPDSPVQITGYMTDSGSALSSTPITVRIFNTTEDYRGVPIRNLTTTTDSYGQFAVTWNAPDAPGAEYEARLFDANGNRIPHDGGRIDLRSTGGGSGFDGPDVDVSADFQTPTYYNVISPGGTASATITATENESALAGETVRYALQYGYDGPVEAMGTVVTNQSGQATVDVPVPTDAPDGESLRLLTSVSVDGETYTDTEYGDLQQFRVEYERPDNVSPGDLSTYQLTFIEAATGDPVSGADMMLAGESSNRLQGSAFASGSAVSGSDGTASVTVQLPQDVSGEVRYNLAHRYDASRYSLIDVSQYDVSLNGVPFDEVQGGDTVTFNYTSTATDSTAAIATVGGYVSGGDYYPVGQLVTEGEQVSFTAPSVPQDEYLEINVRAISDSGVISTESSYIQVAASDSANSMPTADAGTDTTVEANTTVTLDGSGSVDPDGDVLKYNWTQTSGPAVSLSNSGVASPQFDAPAVSSNTTLTFDLTVTDPSGASDTDTVAVTVSPAPSGATVSLVPAATTTQPNGTVTYDVVVENVDAGIGSIGYDVTVGNTTVGTVESVSVNSGFPSTFTTTEFASDGSNVSVQVAGGDTADTGPVTVGNVTIQGQAVGETTVDLSVDSVGDEAGSSYEVAGSQGATLTVANTTVGPAVLTDPATDGDGQFAGDGLYQDVNGDGSVTLADVTTIFNNFNDPSVQGAAGFDFNGDGSVTLADVTTLFNQVA